MTHPSPPARRWPLARIRERKVVRKPPWIGVTVRADERQRADLVVELGGESTGRRVRRKEAFGMQKQRSTAHRSPPEGSHRDSTQPLNTSRCRYSRVKSSLLRSMTAIIMTPPSGPATRIGGSAHHDRRRRQPSLGRYARGGLRQQHVSARRRDRGCCCWRAGARGATHRGLTLPTFSTRHLS